MAALKELASGPELRRVATEPRGLVGASGTPTCSSTARGSCLNGTHRSGGAVIAKLPAASLHQRHLAGQSAMAFDPPADFPDQMVRP